MVAGRKLKYKGMPVNIFGVPSLSVPKKEEKVLKLTAMNA